MEITKELTHQILTDYLPTLMCLSMLSNRILTSMPKLWFKVLKYRPSTVKNFPVTKWGALTLENQLWRWKGTCFGNGPQLGGRTCILHGESRTGELLLAKFSSLACCVFSFDTVACTVSLLQPVVFSPTLSKSLLLYFDLSFLLQRERSNNYYPRDLYDVAISEWNLGVDGYI